MYAIVLTNGKENRKGWLQAAKGTGSENTKYRGGSKVIKKCDLFDKKSKTNNRMIFFSHNHDKSRPYGTIP